MATRYNKMTCESCGEYKDLRFFSKSTRKSGMNTCMDCTDYRTSGGHSGVEFSHPTSEVEWSQRWRETKFTAMEEIVGTFTYKHNYDLANRVEKPIRSLRKPLEQDLGRDDSWLIVMDENRASKILSILADVQVEVVPDLAKKEWQPAEPANAPQDAQTWHWTGISTPVPAASAIFTETPILTSRSTLASTKPVSGINAAVSSAQGHGNTSRNIAAPVKAPVTSAESKACDLINEAEWTTVAFKAASNFGSKYSKASRNENINSGFEKSSAWAKIPTANLDVQLPNYMR